MQRARNVCPGLKIGYECPARKSDRLPFTDMSEERIMDKIEQEVNEESNSNV